MREWLLPCLLTVGTGMLSAWGVGGGTLLLVCLTLFLGVDYATARTVNLLVFLPTALVGLLFHVKKGYPDRKVWRRAAPAGVAAALLASLLTQRLDVSVLEKTFGVFLLCSGVSMFFDRRK